jgi:hypothetical protein
MKPRQFQRSRAEYGSGAARTAWLPHRMRDVAAFARRWANRKGGAARDTVRAIEDQLHALQPICSAQRVPTGIICGGCCRDTRHRRWRPDGAQPRRRPRRDALPSLPGHCAMGDGDLRGRRTRDGVPMRHPPGVHTCGRPTGYLRSVFAVRPIGPGVLAT